MQVINGVFIDLEDCEVKDSINKAIITKQESMLSSRTEVVDGLKNLDVKNQELSDKLDHSLQFQFKKFDELEKENKALSKQLKWQGVKIGASTGGTVAIAVILLILKTFKVF